MSKSPDPIDKLVGQNIRIFRKARGVSQTVLANHLGVTFQQVQKYENGLNRVGSGRLAKIAKVFDVPIDRFFHNRTTDTEGKGEADIVTELLGSPYALQMLKALKNIPDNKLRLSLVRLTERMGRRGD